MEYENLGETLRATDSGAKWKKIGTDRRSGVLVPLFSLYSEKSLGIGDIIDLKLMIDWCHKTGHSLLQLLPMNEVGSTFCPYDSVSSFALEPMYLNVSLLPGAKKGPVKEKIKNIGKVFPAGSRYVDYQIKKEKLLVLREIFNQQKEEAAKEVKKFAHANSYWLHDFALFKVLKDFHGGMAWYEWEETLRVHDMRRLEAFHKEYHDDVLFQMWMQWCLYEQFKSVKEYASSKGVLLKGDLPILVSRDSADVWAHPEFFKLDFAAGAPPDMYCAKGQRWGTPPYNWENIAAGQYTYLKQKLAFAENFYDILRIDHVVGLFRIWSIPQHEPMENKGLNGFFDPGDERVWGGHGDNLLKVINDNTSMLMCAEDLGVIPAVCPQSLKKMGMPGNDVQRWVKDWIREHDFLGPDKYRELSVAMLSTHDTTNWAAWWEYEAGTIDEGLFQRKCQERGFDFSYLKALLFDQKHSQYGRLRWNKNITSADALCFTMGRSRHELLDFVDLYENSYQEKEKLWKRLNLKGHPREKSDPEINRAALKITLESRSIFCINLITDILYLTDSYKGDPYEYRINTPGTISDKNWSLTLPISLEELLALDLNQELKALNKSSERS